MSISSEMPWGTKIEMMPGARKKFPSKKGYGGIYLGSIKNSISIIVIREGRMTPQRWSKNFWRQKT